MITRFIYTLLLILLSHCNIIALESFDELNEKLNTAVGSEKIRLLNIASEKALSFNSQKSLEYSQHAIQLAKKIKDDEGLAISYNNLARIYQKNKNYQLSINYFNKAIEIYKRTNNKEFITVIKSNIAVILYLTNRIGDMKEYIVQIETEVATIKNLNTIKSIYDILFSIYYSQNQIDKAINNRLTLFKRISDDADDEFKIAIYHDLSKAYLRKNDYSNSLKYSLKELSLKEKTGNTDDIESFHFKVAQIYSMDFQFDKAKEHIQSALDISISQNDILSQIKAYTNMANIYNKQNNIDSSIYYYNTALSVIKSNNVDTNLGIIYNNLGLAYKEIKDFDNALKFCQLALNEKIASQDNNIFFPLTSIAEIYLNKDLIDKAFEYAQQANSIAITTKNPVQLAGIYKLYYELYKKSNNYKSALESFQKFIVLNDSLSNQKTQKAIAELEIKYQADKKEHDRALLEQKNIIQRNFFIAFGIMFLLLLFFIYSKYINKKKANDELQSKNQKINQQHKLLEETLAELKVKEKGLIEANITKDKFFSIIAHDLKNPLHAIVLSSDLLLNRFKSMTGEQLVDLINSINKAGIHLSTLLENLLSWARAQSNKINVAQENISLNSLIESVVELQNVNAKEKSIVIENTIEQNLQVYFDKNMLKTVLRNLISNAIKFSFTSSTIRIYAHSDGNFINLSVQDYGTGMKTEDLNKLFKIDVHHSTKGTNAESGTGLGLLLCKDFIELNGGTISVSSEFEVGTTFTISLPTSHFNDVI